MSLFCSLPLLDADAFDGCREDEVQRLVGGRALAGGRQRADVLLDERRDGRLVERADDQEAEVGGVAKAHRVRARHHVLPRAPTAAVVNGRTR